MAMATAQRAAKGSGTIRKKTVTSHGRQYEYWEARMTVGRDPATGRQRQRSFTGKTQREARDKLQAAIQAAGEGRYAAPCRLTVGQWLDIWHRDYLCAAKPATRSIYLSNINNHLKPALGAQRLSELQPDAVQGLISGMQGVGLSPASVRLAYRVLNQALGKAVVLGYLPRNPAGQCALPRMEQREVHPLADEEAAALLRIAQGTEMEQLIWTALFTGCRLSELLGLTWDCVGSQTITINKQLARPEYRDAGLFLSTKSGKPRTLTPAPTVMEVLSAQRVRQRAHRQEAGPVWRDAAGLVFTMPDGAPFDQWRADTLFHRLVLRAGLEGVRFHDLRHTYAVNAIRAGDDVKTVQGNLGHATAAFTLDRYGHFTEQMRQESAARMEGFIKGVLGVERE